MAPAFRIEDVLTPFRGLEQNQDAVVVLGDENAMKVLVAWTHVDNVWTKPSKPAPAIVSGKMSKLWQWVVSGWDTDVMMRDIARAAGLPVAIVHDKLNVLIGNRLIYPDGTMAAGARAALSVHTAKKLGIKQSMPKPPAESGDKGKTEDRSN